MNKIKELDVTENETVDLPTIMTVICHLMTLYALHPCEPLASNINRHIKVVLNSDYLGEWKVVFRQINSQWERLAHQHLQSEKTKQQSVSH